MTTDSPVTTRHRLLARTDSIRFVASRGAFGFFAYGFTLASVLFMLFIVLYPSSYQFSPWLTNAFNSSRRHHFSKVFGHFFSNDSFSPPPSAPLSNSTNEEEVNQNVSSSPQLSRKEGSGLRTYDGVPQVEAPNQKPLASSQKGSSNVVASEEAPKQEPLQNAEKSSSNEVPPVEAPKQEPLQNAEKGSSNGVTPVETPKQEPLLFAEKGSSNGVAPLEVVVPKQEALPSAEKGSSNGVAPVEVPKLEPLPSAEKGSSNGVEHGNNDCDMFEGSWVRDDSYPLYSPGSCPFIDEPFNCFLNGRSENFYEKFRWQPKNCNVPRLNGNDMLEILRGKRLVFVGDSLNRNMWESLVCALRNSVQDKSSIFEASGREEFRTEGSYSFIFNDYNCSVEFVRSPFLVQEWEIPDQKGSTKETLRLDLVEKSCDKYKDADVLIFNTGHWWTHEKTTEGKEYYQEGDHVHGQLSVEEAFHKALLTWSQWVDANVDPSKTTVFFRGYSPSHFVGGEWNSGGQCENETGPLNNESELSESENPPMMRTIESVIERMKTPVFYLNITKMTNFRRDAHPSMYRSMNMSEKTKKYMLTHQDCSHWCLPGVPDLWNELVYAHLLYNRNRNKGQPKT